jgi:hypothetical protein
MPQRMTPYEYYSQTGEYYAPAPQKMAETSVIPDAVWILLGIALVGAFLVAYMAMKTLGDNKKEKKE